MTRVEEGGWEGYVREESVGVLRSEAEEAEGTEALGGIGDEHELIAGAPPHQRQQHHHHIRDSSTTTASKREQLLLHYGAPRPKQSSTRRR
jgi:hypothetical protein